MLACGRRFDSDLRSTVGSLRVPVLAARLGFPMGLVLGELFEDGASDGHNATDFVEESEVIDVAPMQQEVERALARMEPDYEHQLADLEIQSPGNRRSCRVSDRYGPELGLPAAHSGHMSYADWARHRTPPTGTLVQLCTGTVAPWSSVWPDLRHDC